jgi:hypothetical protein
METHHCEDCNKLNTVVRLYQFAPVHWNAETSMASVAPEGFSVTNPKAGRIAKEIVEVCRPCLDKRIADFWDSF